MVEGGRHVLEQFLAAQLADELQLVVAPVLVGDPRAPRFVADVRMPGGGRPRADLAEVRRIEDVVLLRYALSARFEQDDQGGTSP
jgi:5-amino-6-(5-phosphoribosylamino)uracil reductase